MTRAPKAPERGGGSESWLSKRVGLLGLAAVVVVPIAAWLLFAPEYSKVAGSTPACEQSPGPSASPSPSPSPSPSQNGAGDIAPVPLILEKPEGVVLNFWRDRGSQSRTVFLQVAKRNSTRRETGFALVTPGTPLSVSRRPLERQELDGVIGSAQYTALAEVTARKEVALTICVDPSLTDADPGTYSGSVRILGRTIQPVTVPVSVTMQYSGYDWIVPLFAGVIFLAGSFLVWAAGRKAAADRNTTWSIWGELSQFPRWILDNYVGVVAGAIAAVSVFIAKYWRSPPWGARAPEDWFALIGSMFTAYTATLTAAAALITSRGRTRPSVQDQPGDDDARTSLVHR